MQTEPEVITEHSELINSTTIERIITGRDTALVQIEQLIQQLNAFLSSLPESVAATLPTGR